MKCSICGCDIQGYGNNSFPVRKDGNPCCNKCNVEKVIPARLKLINDERKK